VFDAEETGSLTLREMKLFSISAAFNRFLFMACVLSVTWGSAMAASDNGYTLTDLEALEKELSYSEFFTHAMDLRPSERTDYWKKMVENMGESYLKSRLSKTRLEQTDFRQMETLMGWSVPPAPSRSRP